MSICIITHPPFAREYKIYLYCKLRQYVLEWAMTAVFISIVNQDNICTAAGVVHNCSTYTSLFIRPKV